MKYTILFVSAAAELLTVKLESRCQSQLSSWWNTADFKWYGRVSLNGLSYPKDVRQSVITLLLVLQSPRLILTSRYTYDTAGDAQPHAKPLSMEGKIVTETELGKGPMGPNINGIFGIGPPGSSVFSALKTFTPTLWNLVKP
ncbi:uncharacterized protein FOBCDRAFT_277725 [Fusarium oxysporum Fo47]|uniref:Uncharacterized protein n=1 Tax=Fusarium oxysporum Fo47 TaxID=660027 RepID=W9JQD3_FUSOX|nr:uncharacterized protein FOBCDRAFT_277725 [Fusarium oxysporum Fo47]EWZ34272.1 hypothetical protein FOZG_12262 [Fusarium oxysporum Fo47]QKD58065.1 hypothetical protein FOBCDRAFT_277725 [Fusarium oxysporum Fo47]